MSAMTPQTTVIVLGDARSNNLDPRADILRRIAERSKRLVWLNPEGRMAWGWGDSEMPRYSTFCTVVRQCATAQQLERAVSDIVATLSVDQSFVLTRFLHANRSPLRSKTLYLTRRSRP